MNIFCSSIAQYLDYTGDSDTVPACKELESYSQEIYVTDSEEEGVRLTRGVQVNGGTVEYCWIWNKICVLQRNNLVPF